MTNPKPNTARKITILVALGAATAALYYWSRPGKPPPAAIGATGPTQQLQSTTPSPRLTVPLLAETNQPIRLRLAADTLKLSINSAVSRQQFNELRQYLGAVPKDAAVAAIESFLDTKDDAPSLLDFKIGAHGFLTDPSSLRVFLLDQLGQLDPAAAAA